MNKELTQEDYKNILALIAKANIVGQDAIVVAMLQQKIANLLTPSTGVVSEDKKNEDKSKKA